MFSNVFSLIVEEDVGDSRRGDAVTVNSEYKPFNLNPMEKIIVFTDVLEKPANKLHCVSAWDHQFWSTMSHRNKVHFRDTMMHRNYSI